MFGVHYLAHLFRGTSGPRCLGGWHYLRKLIKASLLGYIPSNACRGASFFPSLNRTPPHLLSPDKDILLVATTYDQALNAVIRLNRVGLDRVRGYLDGSIFSWVTSGFKTNRVDQISSEEFHEITQVEHKFVLVDVRSPSEYNESHIEGAINIPAPDLRTRYKELDKKVTTVLQCSTGHRSSLAASILKQHGFDNILNLAGGMKGYNAAGYGPGRPDDRLG